eukprot:PhM_4_TR16706/c0_g2_i1/m.87114
MKRFPFLTSHLRFSSLSSSSPSWVFSTSHRFRSKSAVLRRVYPSGPAGALLQRLHSLHADATRSPHRHEDCISAAERCIKVAAVTTFSVSTCCDVLLALANLNVASNHKSWRCVEAHLFQCCVFIPERMGRAPVAEDIMTLLKAAIAIGGDFLGRVHEIVTWDRQLSMFISDSNSGAGVFFVRMITSYMCEAETVMPGWAPAGAFPVLLGRLLEISPELSAMGLLEIITILGQCAVVTDEQLGPLMDVAAQKLEAIPPRSLADIYNEFTAAGSSSSSSSRPPMAANAREFVCKRVAQKIIDLARKELEMGSAGLTAADIRALYLNINHMLQWRCIQKKQEQLEGEEAHHDHHDHDDDLTAQLEVIDDLMIREYVSASDLVTSTAVLELMYSSGRDSAVSKAKRNARLLEVPPRQTQEGMLVLLEFLSKTDPMRFLQVLDGCQWVHAKLVPGGSLTAYKVATMVINLPWAAIDPHTTQPDNEKEKAVNEQSSSSCSIVLAKLAHCIGGTVPWERVSADDYARLVDVAVVLVRLAGGHVWCQPAVREMLESALVRHSRLERKGCGGKDGEDDQQPQRIKKEDRVQLREHRLSHKRQDQMKNGKSSGERDQQHAAVESLFINNVSYRSAVEGMRVIRALSVDNPALQSTLMKIIVKNLDGNITTGDFRFLIQIVQRSASASTFAWGDSIMAALQPTIERSAPTFTMADVIAVMQACAMCKLKRSLPCYKHLLARVAELATATPPLNFKDIAELSKAAIVVDTSAASPAQILIAYLDVLPGDAASHPICWEQGVDVLECAVWCSKLSAETIVARLLPYMTASEPYPREVATQLRVIIVLHKLGLDKCDLVADMLMAFPAVLKEVQTPLPSDCCPQLCASILCCATTHALVEPIEPICRQLNLTLSNMQQQGGNDGPDVHVLVGSALVCLRTLASAKVYHASLVRTACMTLRKHTAVLDGTQVAQAVHALSVMGVNDTTIIHALLDRAPCVVVSKEEKRLLQDVATLYGRTLHPGSAVKGAR